LLTLLGYEATALDTISLDSVLCGDEQNNSTGAKYFRDLKDEKAVNPNTEATLIRKDGSSLDALLSTSDITFNGKKGYTIIIKDVSINKKFQEELGQSKIKYQNLFDNISTGSFRAVLNSEGGFLEANSAAAHILGFTDKNELLSSTLSHLFIKPADLKTLFQKLSEHGSVKNFVVPVKKHSGTNSVVSFTGVRIRDEYENLYYFDGILEDITVQMKLNEERENLIAELQTSLKFLSEPVEKFVRVPSSVDMNTSINAAAKLMARKKYSAILITSNADTYIGVLTDRDLRERVVAANVNLNEPVYSIMSSPVISINANSSVFQALILMEEKNVRHIAVRDISGSITGIISSEELLKVQRHSSSFLHHEIESVESIEDLIQLKSKIPGLFKTLVDGGAKIKNITQILTGIHDSFVEKIVNHFIAENGNPAVNFVFVSLGSTGRKEHTIISDQDNAIIYEDFHADQSTLQYFNKLGETICNTLNDCGYVFCKGDAMARNPKWCVSLSTWKEYFHKWIVNSSPQDLIDLSIFFDFRPVYGSGELSNKLRDYLFKTAEGQAGFMQHLTKNCLSHKPPVGLLGKIIVESKGDHAETFDIKAATLPIIDFARIYAIKNKIASTNTLERLQGILEIGIINKGTYEELTHAYNILLQLRFNHHVKMLRENRQPTNFINPEDLTQIEQNTLKNAFTQIISIQKKLSYDFSGEAL
jgi:CBS domain-containing protein